MSFLKSGPCGHAAPSERQARPEGVVGRAPRADSRRAAKRRRHVANVARVTALAMAVSGIAAFAAAHKTVTVTLDGESRQVSTFASTVEGLLAQQNVVVGEYDLVAPGVGAQVPRFGEVVVRTAHPLDVVIDGRSQTIWTTASTVEEALADLGVRAGESDLSVARSASVVDLTEAVEVSTPKELIIAVDGELLPVYSAAPTVRELLGEVGVVLGPDDVVEPGLASAPLSGQRVTVHRAAATSGTETVVIPFDVVEQADPTLTKGVKKIKTPGKAGQKVVTYTAVVAGGVEISREVIVEAVTQGPVTQVVLVGTKQPVTVPGVDVNVDPGSAQGIARQMMLDSYGWGDDEFSCLVSLWNRESGWRVNAANRHSGAYGIPQALPGSKMASAGADWQTNPATQIKWGLGYIKGRYSTPCGAWSTFQSRGWY
jgi:uncharacterized protein YabE (DUF348 family)